MGLDCLEILLDSGCSNTIIMDKVCKNSDVKNSAVKWEKPSQNLYY